MRYLGDFRRGATFDFKFVTTTSAGVPTVLAGSPVVKCYSGNSTGTETATGVTLSVDFDAVTGLNNVRIVTTDAFYTPAENFSVVVTTGTVGGVSVVGYVLAGFSIENRFQGEVSQATATGIAAQAITLASGEVGADDRRNGDFVLILTATTGAGQIRQIVTSVASSDVCGVDRAWSPVPTGTIVYRRFPGSLGSTVAEIQSGLATASDQTLVKARTDLLTFSVAGFVDANVMEYNDNGGLTGDGSGTPIAKA